MWKQSQGLRDHPLYGMVEGDVLRDSRRSNVYDVYKAPIRRVSSPPLSFLRRRLFRLGLVFNFDPPIENLIDDAHLERLVGAHEIIPLHQLLDLVEAQLVLFRRQVALVDAVDLAADAEDLLGVDGHVGGLAEVAAGGLVDHDAGVGEAEALLAGAAAEEEGAHAGGLADADGGDCGFKKAGCVFSSLSFLRSRADWVRGASLPSDWM